MPPRLVERFAVGARVEVLLQPRGETAWVEGTVVSHTHPGIWVETAGGARWFVTNGTRIRAAGEGASQNEKAGGGIAFKIASREEWEATERTGVFPGSPADLRDGFVHLSTAEQVRETAAKHFAGRADLVLLDVALDRLDAGTLRWEPSRGGALFPHVHGPLRRGAVARIRPLPLGSDGRHEFPPDGLPGRR
jgi:uncharacterized protein (DUF952 family)